MLTLDAVWKTQQERDDPLDQTAKEKEEEREREKEDQGNSCCQHDLMVMMMMMSLKTEYYFTRRIKIWMQNRKKSNE